MLRLPALNVFAGFAASAEKSAPDPTATAAAHNPRPSAPSVRFGFLTNCTLIAHLPLALITAITVRRLEQ
jgi:hypothetical protein